MMPLKVVLPPAKSSTRTFYDHSDDPWLKNLFMETSSCVTVKQVPAYLKRQSFRPEEFGDGGAFPEIHVSQYPLGLGKTLPVTSVDAQGNVVVKSNKIVYEGDLELEKQIQDTAEETKAEIDKIVNVSKNVMSGSKYIKYKPSQQCATFNSGAKERMVRMVDMAVDPLDPPKFKHKRVPRDSSGSPPVPVMHSPPRPTSVKDKQDWNIPPCISNWKNAKGYTIPLDKRLAANGKGLQEDVQVNDGFAKLSESLFVAEHKTSEAVSMRSKLHKEMVIKDKEIKEQELRALALKARFESMSIRGHVRETEEMEEREKIRKERERERRLEAAGVRKTKITRDRERDISEKFALGMASTGGRGGGGEEFMYDQRLFNQEKGMDFGFATDDQYNVYGKGLFAAQSTLSTLYKPSKDMDNKMYGNADEQVHKLKNTTERFKPDKAFSGGAGKRERPVEFTEEVEEDPFGLAQWASDLKKAKKQFGSGGTIGASGGGGSTSTDHYGASGRTKINFQRGRSSNTSLIQ